MKQLFILISFAFSGSVLAQTYDLQIINTSTEVELEGLSAVEAVQENLTNTELHLRMELLELTAPATWELTLCSPNFCAAPGEYDMLYYLDSGQHGIVKVTFSPGLESGSASAKWVMTDLNVPINTDTIDVTASTLVGMSESSIGDHEITFRPTSTGVLIECPERFTVDLLRPNGQLISSQSGVDVLTTKSPSGQLGAYLIVVRTDKWRLVRRVVF